MRPDLVLGLLVGTVAVAARSRRSPLPPFVKERTPALVAIAVTVGLVRLGLGLAALVAVAILAIATCFPRRPALGIVSIAAAGTLMSLSSAAHASTNERAVAGLVTMLVAGSLWFASRSTGPLHVYALALGVMVGLLLGEPDTEAALLGVGSFVTLVALGTIGWPKMASTLPQASAALAVPIVGAALTGAPPGRPVVFAGAMAMCATVAVWPLARVASRAPRGSRALPALVVGAAVMLGSGAIARAGVVRSGMVRLLQVSTLTYALLIAAMVGGEAAMRWHGRGRP
ncbi:MAG: hypothetical protein HYX32_10460 [Actinobacteria bacterium]|nr:hypothetical protein [Actinomycetota bacterium]